METPMEPQAPPLPPPGQQVKRKREDEEGPLAPGPAPPAGPPSIPPTATASAASSIAPPAAPHAAAEATLLPSNPSAVPPIGVAATGVAATWPPPGQQVKRKREDNR